MDTRNDETLKEIGENSQSTSSAKTVTGKDLSDGSSKYTVENVSPSIKKPLYDVDELYMIKVHAQHSYDMCVSCSWCRSVSREKYARQNDFAAVTNIMSIFLHRDTEMLSRFLEYVVDSLSSFYPLRIRNEVRSKLEDTLSVESLAWQSHPVTSMRELLHIFACHMRKLQAPADEVEFERVYKIIDEALRKLDEMHLNFKEILTSIPTISTARSDTKDCPSLENLYSITLLLLDFICKRLQHLRESINKFRSLLVTHVDRTRAIEKVSEFYKSRLLSPSRSVLDWIKNVHTRTKILPEEHTDSKLSSFEQNPQDNEKCNGIIRQAFQSELLHHITSPPKLEDIPWEIFEFDRANIFSFAYVLQLLTIRTMLLECVFLTISKYGAQIKPHGKCSAAFDEELCRLLGNVSRNGTDEVSDESDVPWGAPRLGAVKTCVTGFASSLLPPGVHLQSCDYIYLEGLCERMVIHGEVDALPEGTSVGMKRKRTDLSHKHDETGVIEKALQCAEYRLYEKRILQFLMKVSAFESSNDCSPLTELELAESAKSLSLRGPVCKDLLVFYSEIHCMMDFHWLTFRTFYIDHLHFK